MKLFRNFRPALAVSIAGLLAATAAQAQETTLRYSRWLPVAYVLEAEVMQPWIEEVARVTEGRVKIEPTAKAVGTVPTQYEVVAEGLADLALFVPGYTPGRFPLIEGLELPFFGDDVATRSPASWRIYEKHLAPTGVFEEVHLLSMFTTNSGQMLSTGATPPAAPADFRGKKIRINSPLTQLTELLGAVPVVKPVSEIYELASGGMIDGSIIPVDTAAGYKLETVMKGIAVVPGGLGTNTIALAINKDVWEKISEADRAAITALSGELLSQQAGTAQKGALDKAYAAFKAAGTNVVPMTDEVGAELAALLAPVRSIWVGVAKSRGLADPETVLKELEAEIGMM